MNRSSVSDRGHKAVRIIERTWQHLRTLTPDLPPVVIVLLAAGLRARHLGHFAPAVWKFNEASGAHEIAINPRLFTDPKAVLLVLLHEAAHSLNYSRGIDDCSGKEHYYHRREFRKAAEELGLESAFYNTRYGWTATSFPNGQVPEQYTEALQILKKLPFGTQKQQTLDFPRGRKTPESGHVRLQCACSGDNVRRIYVAKATVEKGGIRCEQCKCLFVVS